MQRFYCRQRSLKIVFTHDDIKKELRENGPLMVGLEIFEDFLNYEEGIYWQTSGVSVGGHTMKLEGWGTDPDEGLYWQLQNQWSTDWGEQGYVRVRAGEIGIDSVGLSCMPDFL